MTDSWPLVSPPPPLLWADLDNRGRRITSLPLSIGHRSPMKFVTYNIQYSLGQDGFHDLERIAAALADADVIGLQEVVRNVKGVPDRDQPARLGQLLPTYYWVYGPTVDLDASAKSAGGTVTNARYQFGNMVLSRWPILSSRLILLPRILTTDTSNGQRGALEAIVDAPSGPIRVYSVHLDNHSPARRQDELRFLLPRLFVVPQEGSSFSGPSWLGQPHSVTPDDFVVLGDFNLGPDSDEYREIVDLQDLGGTTQGHLVDTWTAAGPALRHGVTWYADPADPRSGIRVDYGFVSSGLADRISAAWIDDEAVGSDHQPAWFHLSE